MSRLLIPLLVTVLMPLLIASVMPLSNAQELNGEKAYGLKLIQAQKIWDAAPHNAFTDLIHWRGRFYCSFREGEAHASYDGVARVLVSEDGKVWKPLTSFVDKGLDLRDPRLCVLPDGKLLLSVGVRKQTGKALLRSGRRNTFACCRPIFSLPSRTNDWFYALRPVAVKFSSHSHIILRQLEPEPGN